MRSAVTPIASSMASTASSKSAAIEAGRGPWSIRRGVTSRRAGMTPARGTQPVSADGSPGVGPARIPNSSAASATLVAIGPLVDWSIQVGIGSRPSSPFVGFSPTSPQYAAGIRIEPAPSVPVANGARPIASAAALPPLDPPGDQSSAHGLFVSPNSRFDVNPASANSGRLVLPTTIAPAARRRPTTSQSRSSGSASRCSSEP